MRLVQIGPLLGPAGRVTLLRALLSGAVAAAAVRPPVSRTGVLVTCSVATLALLLDGVDGWVARRTATETAFGARFDMEADAFLIAALSVLVARDLGWWVLLAGAARYLLWLAGRVWPWLRGEVPRRPWARVVAVVQTVVLIAAASQLLPRWVATSLLVAGLALLAESFAHQVRRLHDARAPQPAAPRELARHG